MLLPLGFALPLILATACRKPEVQVSDPAPAAADQAMAGLPESQQRDFREGFLNGVQMVREAVRTGRRPFLLRLGEGSAPARPVEALPAGAAVVDEASTAVEVDPQTGLEIRLVPSGFDAGFVRGQVAGFQWALDLNRSALTRPKTVPALPDSWERASGEGLIRLQGQDQTVIVQWMPGLLTWSIGGAGFPVRRHWRPAPAWMRPSHGALAGDAFWVETPRGALALDLESGAIRSVQPAQSHETQVAPDSLEAHLAAAKAERLRRMPDAEGLAERGNVEAMMALGREAEDLEMKFSWFRRAAEAGHGPAMMEVASMCYQGRGVAENRAEARRWFEKAAKAGHAGAREALEGLFNP